MSVAYPAITVEGGLISAALLQRVAEGDLGIVSTTPESYGLQPGESVRRLADHAYRYLREVWQDYAKYRDRAGAGAARQARDRWLLVLLRQLGYDGIQALPSGIAVENKDFAISHQWGSVPIHLLGWGVDLDHRTPGLRGAASAAPHTLVQHVLNQSDAHLWGIVSNGQKLRLLRDSTSLAGIAYLEFDLEAIFDGALFPDFVLFYRVAHATRLAAQKPDQDPASCVLERWRQVGVEEGERALKRLRTGVESALTILGTGFLDHPANGPLRAAVGSTWSEADFHRSLLRLVYRLLFWFVSEDRDVLLDPMTSAQARQRYADFFSSRRLRELAVARRYSRHGDLWQQVQVILAGLGGSGLPQLGLPALGGLFTTKHRDNPLRTLPLDQPLDGVQLTNAALLQAVEALAVLPGDSAVRRRRVDFRHLGAEELGSVYEGLLEFRPRWDAAARRYHLEGSLLGNERKTTGSYYTPSSLVEALLDSALDPLLEEARSSKDPRQALLGLTVCDPACGSGHFLIAAARRIARAYAAEETGEPEPTPEAVRTAVRTVIGRCIHGVDINDMAAELAKVSLWLEAMEPGRPLGFLDANIRVGNSLLGVTPRLLADGIPDTAYFPLIGDDRSLLSALREHKERNDAGQLTFFSEDAVRTGNAALAKARDAIGAVVVHSLDDVHVQEQRAVELDAVRRKPVLIANAWCAAFVQHRTPALAATIVTRAMLTRLQHDPDQLDLVPLVEAVEQVAAQYRFFHWHLEFPHIFRVPEIGLGEEPPGWDGGFTLVIGNPPWEKVELAQAEFFAARDPDIANAATAARRKQAIKELGGVGATPEQRALHQEWLDAQRDADGTRHLLQSSGRYPQTGHGRINTSAVFAETGRAILSATGRFGMILPTGIATDATTQAFFKDLILAKSLVSIYDFENEEKVFPEVHHSYRFSMLTVSGRVCPSDRVSLAFRARRVDQIASRAHTIAPEEIALLNPNTGTCPVFNSRHDAELTVAIYRRVPILWRDDDPTGNSWDVWFRQGLFNMATDSELFHTSDELTRDGWCLDGNVFRRSDERMLPLYEAKMAHFFDHRLGTYQGATEAQLKVGTLPRLDDAAHDDPRCAPLPRYWVTELGSREKPGVENRLAGRWKRGWLLGWRDVARSIDERTLIATVVPLAGAGHKLPLIFTNRMPACLHANLSALVLDYVLRQKISSASVPLFAVKQLPVLPQSTYRRVVPWDDRAESLERWLTDRVLELTYTAWDLDAYARDLGDRGAPFRWVPERRALMRAELDAAYFHLYSVERDDVDYIVETFKVVRQRDMAVYGEFRTKRFILDRYEAIATAINTSTPYQTPLEPAPGRGPRHSADS